MSFDFAINRVACAQICRANGIDRCSPIALDSLSDIMTRFMTLLASSSMKAAAIKGTDLPTVDDVVFALEELHMLPPHLDPSDCEGVLELLAWLKGPGPQRAIQVSKLQQQTLSALGVAQGAALAQQQGSHEMQGLGARVDDRADWLRQMVDKQVLMGHDQKFQSTIFGETQTAPVEIVGTDLLEGASAETLSAVHGANILPEKRAPEPAAEPAAEPGAEPSEPSELSVNEAAENEAREHIEPGVEQGTAQTEAAAEPQAA